MIPGADAWQILGYLARGGSALSGNRLQHIDQETLKFQGTTGLDICAVMLETGSPAVMLETGSLELAMLAVASCAPRLIG